MNTVIYEVQLRLSRDSSKIILIDADNLFVFGAADLNLMKRFYLGKNIERFGKFVIYNKRMESWEFCGEKAEARDSDYWEASVGALGCNFGDKRGLWISWLAAETVDFRSPVSLYPDAKFPCEGRARLRLHRQKTLEVFATFSVSIKARIEQFVVIR